MNSWSAFVLAISPFVLGLVLIVAIAKLTFSYLQGAQDRPYFTWYLLHLGVGLLGLLVILVLATRHVLTAAATAVVASIVSYGLGAATTHHTPSVPQKPDIASRLSTLQGLRDTSVISEDEYNARRTSMLDEL